MRPRKTSCIIEKIRTVEAIYNSINYPYDIFAIQKMNSEEESIYQQEKFQMISEITKYISNYCSKIKPSDFNLAGLNPRYLTISDLKLIEDLLKKGLTEEEVRVFIMVTCPQEITNQYVDREKVINKSRERSLYLKKRFNKDIKED